MWSGNGRRDKGEDMRGHVTQQLCLALSAHPAAVREGSPLPVCVCD